MIGIVENIKDNKIIEYNGNEVDKEIIKTIFYIFQ